jgi:diamine N-acetyltransferase
MLGTELKGEFVDLRLLQNTDAEVTLRWRTGNRASLMNPGAVTLEQQAVWIFSWSAFEFNFFLSMKKGCPIGMLSLISVDHRHRRGEVARFLIGDQQAVQGIPAAVEAMFLLYKFAFDELNLQRLFGVVVSGNPLMLKWHRYMGLTEEGRLKRHYFMDQQFQDGICVALLVEEYRKKTLPRMQALLASMRSAKS